MRISLAMWLASLAGAIACAPAQAQMYVTSVTAAVPDPNGKVPAFNAVPGAGIVNWSNGIAQAVLTQGQSYNYCVSLATATAGGSATVEYKITRGKTIIQSAVIIRAKDFTVGSDGVWYYCSGYKALPDSPGPATLYGVVLYAATGATKPVVSDIAVPVLLQ